MIRVPEEYYNTDIIDVEQEYLGNLMERYEQQEQQEYDRFFHMSTRVDRFMRTTSSNGNLDRSQSPEITSDNKNTESRQHQLDRSIWAAHSGDKDKPYVLDVTCFPFKSAAGTKLVDWAENQVENASYQKFSKKTSSLMKHYKKVISQHIPQDLTGVERIDLCAAVGIVFPKIAKRYRQFMKAKEDGDEVDGESKTKLKSVVSDYLLAKLDKRYSIRQEEAN